MTGSWSSVAERLSEAEDMRILSELASMPAPASCVVVVQTIRGRDAAFTETLEGLIASDLLRHGVGVAVSQQLPGETMKDNFKRALGLLRQNDAAIGIRLEDDVLVSRHLIHNVLTWGALAEDDFGAGWLFCSRLLQDQIVHEWQRGTVERSTEITLDGHVRRTTSLTAGSLGVVIKTNLVEELLDWIDEAWDQPGVDGAQDKALSWSLAKMGRSLYIHTSPPLVEHNVKHVSTLAPDRIVVPELHTTGGLFDSSFRREGVIPKEWTR